MRIPDETIEEIRSASDVVDVVGEYVPLRQRGANYFGLCPFHAEKTPSFSVNARLGIYKCFGCGVGGDVFDFMMAIERVEFIEAARILAERAVIALPESEQAPEASSNEAIYHALTFAARFYHRQLTSEPHGRRVLNYLAERGFTASSIKHFGLGYAPDAWDALLGAAEDAHIASEVLESGGLVVPRRDGSGYYDRFRERLIFPIISHLGKVLGFGGRILETAPDQPKYINSPETAVYHKGRVLYGLNHAKQAIRRLGEAILVEGYTDVISLHQAGIENVVASSGTALTADQVRLLRRYAERVVLLYDADAAGDAAMIRGLELLVSHGLMPHALPLPQGEDPDSFVRERGGDGFAAHLRDQRQDLVEFRYGLASKVGLATTPDGQVQAVGHVLDLIVLIDDPLAREAYLQKASSVSGMPLTTLWRGLEQRRSRRHAVQRRAPERASLPGGKWADPGVVTTALQSGTTAAAVQSLPAEEALLRLMLENGSWMIEFVLSHMNHEEFSDGLPRRMVQAILAVFDEGPFVLQKVIHSGADPALRGYAAELLTDRETPSANWTRKKNIPVPQLNEDALDAAAGAMTQLKLLRVHAEIERLKRDTLRAQQIGTDVSDLQRERIQLHDLRKQIESREFIKWPEYIEKKARN